MNSPLTAMRPCPHHHDLAQSIRAGQYPHACPPELRGHVAACPTCAAEARLLCAFAAARQSAALPPTAQSPGILWWRAQLRRRQEAFQQLERPNLALPAITLTGSLLILLAILVTLSRRADWPALFATVSLSSWNPWLLALIAASVCAFVAVTVVLMRSPEEGR